MIDTEKNWLVSMASKDGKVSHTRGISLFITFVLAILQCIFLYKAIKCEKYDLVVTMFGYDLLFISVMSGVAKISDIQALKYGGNSPTTTGTPVKPTVSKPSNNDPVIDEPGH